MTARANTIAAILAAGIVAGTLDITYAAVFWALKADVPATRIFQSVAAGVLGADSFQGGTATAALGLLLHYFIAVLMAAAFVLAALRRTALRDHPVLSGAVYGLFLYLVMQYVVVPLTAASAGPRDALWIGLSVLAHALLVGVPIGLLTRYLLPVSPQTS